VTGATIELFDTDGAQGAAWGAAVGAGLLDSPSAIVSNLKKLETVEPDRSTRSATKTQYKAWLKNLENRLQEE
jgi:xylulokinase